MSKQQSFDQTFNFSQDQAVLASLALPRNPLAGAIFAGHHLWWKGDDVGKELARVEDENETNPKKASFLQYGATSSLSDLSQGLRAEMAWNSGGILKEDKRYLGLQTIGSKADAKKYLETIFVETIPWIKAAAKTSLENSEKLLSEYLGREQDEAMAGKTMETMLKDTKTAEDELFEAYGTTQVEELKILAAAQKAVIDAYEFVVEDGDIFTEALEKSTEEAAFPKTELENYRKWLDTYKDKIAELQKQKKVTETAMGKKVRALEESVRRLRDQLATADQSHLRILAKRKDLSARYADYVKGSRKRMQIEKEKIRKKMQASADAAAAAAKEHSNRLAGMLKNCETRLAEFDLKRKEEHKISEKKVGSMEHLLKEVEKKVQEKEKSNKELKDENALLGKANTDTEETLEEEVEKNKKLNKLVEAYKNLENTQTEEIKQDHAEANQRLSVALKENTQNIAQEEEIKKEKEKIEVLSSSTGSKPGPPTGNRVLDSWIFPKTKGDAIESVFHLNQNLQNTEINKQKAAKDPNKSTLWSLVFDGYGKENKENFAKFKQQRTYVGQPQSPSMAVGEAPTVPGDIDARKHTSPAIYYNLEGPAAFEIDMPSRFVSPGTKANPWPKKADFNGPHVFIGFSAYVQILKDDNTTTRFFVNQELKPDDKTVAGVLKGTKLGIKFLPTQWFLQINTLGIGSTFRGQLADSSTAYSGNEKKILKTVEDRNDWVNIKANVTRVYLHKDKKIINDWKIEKAEQLAALKKGETYEDMAKKSRKWLLDHQKNLSFVTDTNIMGTPQKNPLEIVKTKLPNNSDKWLRQTSFTATPEFW